MNAPELVWVDTAPVKAGWYWADHEGLREPGVVEVYRLPDDRLTVKQVSPDAGQIQFFPLGIFQRWAGPIELPSTRVTPGAAQGVAL